MPTLIAVVFDNPAAVYFSGQTIGGHIQVICDKPKSCRGIEVEFCGYGRVHWTERKETGTGDNKRTETKHYTSSENYYKRKYYVWGNGSATSELPPGTHVFNFSFLLPQGIPSSFESHVGKVRHHCKAKIDIPWKTDKTCLRPYSVNALYDLNMDGQATMKIECTKHDYMCCFWCRSGPLSLVLRVDRSGYVPGENMVINAEISNMTTVRVNYSKAVINQSTTYYADGNKKKEHRKVAELKHPEIAAGGDDIWSGVNLQIPALPPSHLQFCNIIDIAYEFKFKVEPSGCHLDLEYEVPIIIGSIPLQQYFNLFANNSMTYPGQPGVPYQPGNGLGQPPVGPGYDPQVPPVPGFSTPGYPAPGQPVGYPAPGQPAGYPAPGQPAGYPAPGQPAGYVAPGQPAPAVGFAVGQPTAPGYPPQPAYNPAGAGGINSSPYNPNMPPTAYPGPPQPSAPMFPGSTQYPGMPLPVYNPCMLGVSSYAEDDSDDERGQSGMKYAPHYVSYSLVDSKHQQSGPGFGAIAAAGGLAAVGGILAAGALHKRHGSGSSSSSSSSDGGEHFEDRDKQPLVIHHHHYHSDSDREDDVRPVEHHHHYHSDSDREDHVRPAEPEPVLVPIPVPEPDCGASSHSSSSSSSSEEEADKPEPEEEPEPEPEEEPEPEPEEEPEPEPEEEPEEDE